MESFSKGELKKFLTHFEENKDGQFSNTLDYLQTSLGLTYNKEYPTKSIFCLALLHEILVHLNPGHFLWSKVKSAAFILNLSERSLVDFGLLYKVFHQIEEKVNSQVLHWEDESVKKLIEDEIASKVGFISKEEYLNDFDEPIDLKPDIGELSMDIKHATGTIENRGDNPPKEEFTSPKFDMNVTLEENNINVEAFSLDTDTSQIRNYRRSKRFVKYDDDPLQELLGLSPLKDKKKTYKNMYEKQLHRKRYLKDENGEIIYRKGQHKWNSEHFKKRKKCKKCRTIFNYQKALDKHDFEVHKGTKLCAECGHVSTTYIDYISHDKTHLVQCNHCDKKFFGSQTLQIHIKKYHVNKDEEKIPCELCGALYAATSLVGHMYSKHRDNETKEYKCDFYKCDYVTANKYYLTQHKKSHFKQLEKCPECGGMFKKLSLHYRRSCPARKYERHPCHLCDSTFKMKQGLQKHIRGQHMGISEFQCEQCEYAAKDSITLKGHVLSKHENKRLYSYCKICSKKTSNTDYHLKTYHLEEYLKNLDVDSPSEAKDKNENSSVNTYEAVQSC